MARPLQSTYYEMEDNLWNMPAFPIRYDYPDGSTWISNTLGKHLSGYNQHVIPPYDVLGPDLTGHHLTLSGRLWMGIHSALSAGVRLAWATA